MAARVATRAASALRLRLQEAGGEVQEIIQCLPQHFLKEDSPAAGHEAHGDAQQGPADVPGPAEQAGGYPVGSLGGGDFLRLCGSGWAKLSILFRKSLYDKFRSR